MGWVNDARLELQAGRTAKVRPLGGSMRGRIESGQLVALAPCNGADVAVGDAVLVEWHGGFLLHLVKEIRNGRLLIGNNLGKVNGWVAESAVIGKVVAVGEMEIRPFAAADEDAVVALWEQCGLTRPWNDPRKDIRRKSAVRPDLFLVGVLGGRVVATAMAGYEGHRGWINYLGVSPEHRRQGLGRELMAAAERLLREAGAPKINLQVRTGNQDVIAFYRRLGYAVDEVVSLGKRLEADGPALPRG